MFLRNALLLGAGCLVAALAAPQAEAGHRHGRAYHSNSCGKRVVVRSGCNYRSRDRVIIHRGGHVHRGHYGHRGGYHHRGYHRGGKTIIVDGGRRCDRGGTIIIKSGRGHRHGYHRGRGYVRNHGHFGRNYGHHRGGKIIVRR